MGGNDWQEPLGGGVFSWRGLLIAPAIVPLLASLVFAALAGGNAIFGFLFGFIASSVICYGATLFIALPCLWCLSFFTRLTTAKTAVVGGLLGAVVWLPLTVFEWSSSGPDSGPPEVALLVFLCERLVDWTTPLLVAAGATTAAAYWKIANR